MKRPPKVLNRIVDKVLAYKPKKQSDKKVKKNERKSKNQD